MRLFSAAVCIDAVCKFSSLSLQDAFVEELNGPHLFKSMLKNDPEAETLHRVPGMPPLLQTYPLLFGFLIQMCTLIMT